jgi:hypothetical protein
MYTRRPSNGICKSIQILYCLMYIYIIIEDPIIRERERVGIPLTEREGWNSFNRFNPATFFVSVPSQNLDFQCQMLPFL